MQNSINPFDDLYQVDEIKNYFGIDIITKNRAQLEARYWLLISQILIQRGHSTASEPRPPHHKRAFDIANSFEYSTIQKHLQDTKHEIKALEYTMRDMFIEAGLPAAELIHWGLTSQDIVDPVYTLAIRNCTRDLLIPSIEDILHSIYTFGEEVAGEDSAFPARTHGQLAVPTTMHRELGVYHYRLDAALTNLTVDNQKLKVKFGGAIGSLAVHAFVDPHFDYSGEFEKMFRNLWDIGVHECTTQVNGNDDKARVFASLIGINNIIIDLCQDIWQYFSNGYLTILRDPKYVGSSTMAQKNNPIEFENIEGILQHVNQELHFMMDKLTRSRGQRDLTDSVVQRFYGLMFAQMLHAYKRLSTAISKLEFIKVNGQSDLDNNAQVHAELLQSCAKLAGTDRFEEIKHLMNGKVGIDDFMEIIRTKFPELTDKFTKLHFYGKAK